MADQPSAASRRAALTLIGVSGVLSAISASFLLGYLLWCAFLARHPSPLTNGVRNFSRTPMGRYFIALLFFDTIQGIGFAINLHWGDVGHIVADRTCVAQGIISQIGEQGVAIFSLIIAFHTFWLLFLQRKPARWATILAPACALGLVAIMPIIGSFAMHTQKKGPFWGPSGPNVWCWLTNAYTDMRIPMVYVLTSLFCSAFIYPLIYLKFEGIIEHDLFTRTFSFHCFPQKVHGLQSSQTPRIRSLNISTRGSDENEGSNQLSKRSIKIARRLMWYPFVLTVIVIPVAICRLGGLAGWEPPFWFYSIAGVCFASSGYANAALFLFTRHTFIQAVTQPTAIHVTTQRFTTGDVEEDNSRKGSNDVMDLKAFHSPINSSFALRFEEPPSAKLKSPHSDASGELENDAHSSSSYPYKDVGLDSPQRFCR